MNIKTLDAAVALAEKLTHVYVATADEHGVPHVAAAGELRRASPDKVAVAAWFCPGTLANLGRNRNIALVVWDASTDDGFQIIGEVEKIEETAMLDGYSPGIEGESAIPQIEKSLDVRVYKIFVFRHAPHSDAEE
jgi:predicted pyridoxine 5'-phosphate oxidase superfamily flavin-nucleotide-binding protein